MPAGRRRYFRGLALLSATPHLPGGGVGQRAAGGWIDAVIRDSAKGSDRRQGIFIVTGKVPPVPPPIPVPDGCR